MSEESVQNPVVKIKCLDKDFMPVYKHAGDAGADVKAWNIPACEDSAKLDTYTTVYGVEDGRVIDWSYSLQPGKTVLINCGFACEPPDGWVFLVCPRSGLASNNHLTLLDAPGVCDAGYRGQYGVLLFNTGTQPFEIHKGDRIAQIVLSYAPQAKFIDSELSCSERGERGFGSSGVSERKKVESVEDILKESKIDKTRLDQIAQVAGDVAAVRWMYCSTSSAEHVKQENLFTSLQQSEEKLRQLTEEFLANFPEVEEEDLQEFIRKVQGCTNALTEYWSKISYYQNKNDRILQEFLQKGKLK